MFNVKKVNLDQARAVIKQYGQVWIHGDGNLFPNKEDSDFRKDFCNPDQEASKYRAHFTSVEDVPTSVNQMEKILQNSHHKEKTAEKNKDRKDGPQVKMLHSGTQQAQAGDDDDNAEVSDAGMAAAEERLNRLAQTEEYLRSHGQELDKREADLEAKSKAQLDEIAKSRQDAMEELNQRQQDLDRKIADLKAREDALKEKEAKAKKS